MFFTEKKVLVGFCLVSLFTLLSQSVTLAEWIPGGVSFVEASNTQSVGDLSAGEQLGDNRWEYRNPSPDLVQELESEQSLQPQTENSPDICWGCDGPWFTVPGYSDGIIETDPESGSKIIDQKNLEIDNELPAEIRRWVENSRDEFGGQSRLYDGKLYLLVTYGEKRTGASGAGGDVGFRIARTP